LAASGKLPEALDTLLMLEEQTRKVSDLSFYIITTTHFIICTVITLLVSIHIIYTYLYFIPTYLILSTYQTANCAYHPCL